ncbi:hypothetical protein [Adonisia turfae]
MAERPQEVSRRDWRALKPEERRLLQRRLLLSSGEALDHQRVYQGLTQVELRAATLMTDADGRAGRIVYEARHVLRRRGRCPLGADLTEPRAAALLQLSRGFAMLIRVCGGGSTLLGRLVEEGALLDRGAAGGPEGPTPLDDLRDWWLACKAAGVDSGAVADAIGHGLTLRDIDRARNRRKGWAKGTLLAGLDVAVAVFRLDSPSAPGEAPIETAQFGT